VTYLASTSIAGSLPAANVDHVMFERARAGDATAFATLYAAHVNYVGRVVSRILGPDAEELDDVIQETFCDALDGLRGLHEPKALRAWLVTVAVRKTQRAIGRRIRRRTLTRVFGLLSPVATNPGARAELDNLQEALERLPADLRIPWVLARVEDWPLQDVANACKVSLATVKRRVREAEARIERVLSV
jgi:RNA polymerase sigma-70 factor, ECF subfamily